MSKREYPRYRVEAYVDFTGHEVLLYHGIRNISLGGICIQTPTVEPIGTRVDVLVTFPDLGREMALAGEVVWANLQPPKDVGIRWVDMTDEQRDELRAYFDRVNARLVSSKDDAEP